MTKELKSFLDILKQMDNDHQISESFMNDLVKKNAKFEAIQVIIHNIIHETYGYSCAETSSETRKFLERVNLRYSNSHTNYCWQSHDAHFHMTIQDWINCPMTCLTEIQEFVEKLLKGD